MIDEFTVLHRGGMVLFQQSLSPVRGNPVNQVIKKVLMEDRAGDGSFQHDEYKVEWLLDNERECIYVVVYQHLLALGYVPELLDAAKDSFLASFGDDLVRRTYLQDPPAFHAKVAGFGDEFRTLLRTVESAAEMMRKESRRQLRASSPSGTGAAAAAAAASPSTPGGPGEAAAVDAPTSPGGSSTASPTLERKLTGQAALIEKWKKQQERGGTGGKKTQKPAAKPKPKKVMRQGWSGNNQPASPSYSPDSDGDEPREIKQTEDPLAKPTDMDGWRPEQRTAQPRSRFATFLRDRFGSSRSIDDQDLDTILPELRDTLMSKNVAQEIVESLLSSARAELVGKNIPNLQSLSQCIKDSLTSSLLRILTPKKDVNILRDVAKAKEMGRPFTIAFCGVNGVGKSTNLSKVAYWLRSNDLTVLIAACDTFRSGAVEQLKVHSGRIGVPVFDQGYAKDAAEVAKQAIDTAKKNRDDVVLIDTAGRMQDNEPLMRSLAKLIHNNRPDLVLFVGEALVGNDGVDQLRKFNSSLEDFTPPGLAQRGIDGIVLTKFDTIDDKVGAAISMVYQSGQPIVFVGVGQSYQDLRTLNPEVVVASLLN